jgi:hypothetical protein
MMKREVLTAEQVEFYRSEGYLVLENRIPMDIIESIRAEISRFHDEARGMTASNDRLDLEDSHTPDDPRVRRIKLPHQISAGFAQFGPHPRPRARPLWAEPAPQHDKTEHEISAVWCGSRVASGLGLLSADE